MFRDGESVLQHVQMKVHPPKIMGCIGVPSSSLIPLLKEPANGVTMRIGRPDGRTYRGYCPCPVRGNDRARRRVAIQIIPVDTESQSELCRKLKNYILRLPSEVKALVWWRELIRSPISGPLAVLHRLRDDEGRITLKTPQSCWEDWCFVRNHGPHIYSLGGAMIGIVEDPGVGSVMEMDQHSKD